MPSSANRNAHASAVYKCFHWELSKKVAEMVKLLQGSLGVYTFHCADPLLLWQGLDHLLDQLMNHYRALAGSGVEMSLRFADGAELSAQWIDENLFTPYLPMFADQEEILVIKNYGQIPEEAAKRLLMRVTALLEKREQGKFFFDHPVVFVSDIEVSSASGGGTGVGAAKKGRRKKSGGGAAGLFALFVESGIGAHLISELPKFWQYRQLLDFWEAAMALRLAIDAKELILKSISGSDTPIYDLHHTLQMLELQVSGSGSEEAVLAAHDIRDKIASPKIDKFSLAKLFSEREKGKREEFYRSLVQSQSSYDDLRSFFFFMQGHLAKLANYRTLLAQVRDGQKAKASSYEQEIIRVGGRWKGDEIRFAVRMFSELELLAKQRHPMLNAMLRSKHIENI
ncbi:MAG: hypothetical protein HQK50_02755 [Oligoflexia bacterium]|nr:hypothetical protein [Oligoflexia bacterium]MBF0364461.1 hypothetical protein [Oligoflexia bacterium]